MDPLGLLGRHNRRNALIARRCLVALGVPEANDDTRLTAAAQDYRHLPSRLAPIGTVEGVTFVDDSLSTNVLPTLAALDSLPGRRVALIVGGHDRGIDYAPLAAGVLARKAPTRVLTLPDSGPRINAEIAAHNRMYPERRVRGPDRLPRPGGGGRRRASPGPARTAWSCSRPPRRASGTSATTATAARPSPTPSARSPDHQAQVTS